MQVFIISLRPDLRGMVRKFGLVLTVYNWASVSEPHTCDFNAAFSLLLLLLYVVLSKIVINISIFHFGSYIYVARAPWARSLGRPSIAALWADCIRNFGGVGGQAIIARR